MASEDRTPDFEDLLAAFDIPDVPAVSAGLREQDHPFVGWPIGRGNAIAQNSYRSPDKKSGIDEQALMPTSKLTFGGTQQSSSLLSAGDGSTRRYPTFVSHQNDNKVDAAFTSNGNINGSVANNGVAFGPADVSDETTYQLSTNVLPPFVPMTPPEKFKSIFMSESFKCVECGDRFLLESSLVQHSQRRSVYITFSCDTCKQMLVYYNRCNLLSHIHSHREKNQPADIKKAEITPLPRELMSEIQPPPSVEEINGSARVSPPNRRTTTVSVNGSPRLPKAGAKNVDGKFRCSECLQFFESVTAIEDHFGRSQNMPLATSQCSKCNMTCPSKCSLSAHQRIHLQSKPFVCPECGQKVSENWIAFQRHLSIKCLHYSRSIGYKCSKCALLFGAGELLRQHIITTHTDAYYKCQACPMAFKSGATFDTHKKTAHLTMDVQCKTISKCPLCDTVFHSIELLHAHLDVHINEQIKATKFVFKCLECSKLLESKCALVDHLKGVHPSAYSKEICIHCGKEFADAGSLSSHVKASHASPETSAAKQARAPTHQGLTKCKQCGRVFQTGHGYNIHKQRCHGNATFSVCFVCNMKCSSRLEMALHGRRHQKEGVLLCTVCNNLTFESRNGLGKHLDTHAGNMKLPAKCDYCEMEMKTVDVAASHLKLEHGFSSFRCDKCDWMFHTVKSLTRHQRVLHNPNGPRRKYVCWICKERDFGKRSFLEKHIVTVHKVLVKNIDFSQMTRLNRPPIKIKIPRPVYMAAVEKEENAVADAIATTPSKKLRVSDESGLYVCSKCNFTVADRSVFLEHIGRHKTEQSSYQCHECGACFVVRPSLGKHLSIIHKIEDPDQYLVDEKIVQDEFGNQGSDSECNGSANPLECKVCNQSFANDVLLKAHMRTHGMAFIRSRRLVSMSESSPSSS